MKNKNGFAIIETLVTTVVLATALISVYVLFTNFMVREKRRLYYDDPIYVVRANYIFDTFFDLLKKSSTEPGNQDDSTYVSLEDYLTVGSEKNHTTDTLYLVSFSCDNDVFPDKAQCQEFFYNMRLYRVYISRFDLSYVYTCEESESTKCITYNLLNEQTKLYLKSLPYVPAPENAPLAGGYYIIFEFIENGDGGVCSNDDCMREYAVIKYGGSNTVINVR